MSTMNRLVPAVLFAGLAGAPTLSAQAGVSSNLVPRNGPQPAVSSRVVGVGNGVSCSVIDFEGFADGVPIGTVPGTPTVTFGPSWLGLVDADAGGNGNFANEPSASTACFFLNTLDPIDFDQPVQYVQIFYVASGISLPVTLTAWDGPGGTGNVLATASGNTVGTDFDGASCTGDPNGAFCLWDSISLATPTDSILSITISGAVANQFAFDNMTFCTALPCDTDASVTVVPDTGGRNVPNSIAASPAGALPEIGNALFAVALDDPADACGIESGALTYFLLSTGVDSRLVNRIGCNGGIGEVMIATDPAPSIYGPVMWNGPGNPAVHPVPIPFDTSLCGITCYGQGLFVFDVPIKFANEYRATARIDLTVGT